MIHIVSEVSDAEKFEMLEKYVKVCGLDSVEFEKTQRAGFLFVKDDVFF